jgi:hypothetical protein
MSQLQEAKQGDQAGRLQQGVRVIAAALVIALVAVYLLAVLSGWVAGARRLGLTEIALALVALGVAALLVQPNLLDVVSSFQVAGLQVQLRQLKEGQQSQTQQLDEMRFLILLLLGEKASKYLTELSTGEPSLHDGDSQLRDALRSLRAAGLIRMKGAHHISELKDGVVKRDIRELAEITDDGRRLMQRIGSQERSQAPVTSSAT